MKRATTTTLSLLATAAGVLAADVTKFSNRTIERVISLRSHTIFAPYIDQDLQNRWWDFGADAYVNTMKHIRLTQARQSEVGWLWSRIPLTAQNFQFEVEFKIDGEATHLYGDGMAVWLTKERALQGPVFGSKDKFEGFGIFIDTFANSRHSYSFPRIVGMKGDGETAYDVGGDGELGAAGACSAAVRGASVATKMRVTYIKGEYIDVQLQHKAWDEWTDCFTIQNYTLPNAPYLGFSAHTGDVFDFHDIISVSTNSLVIPIPQDTKGKIKVQKPQTKHGHGVPTMPDYVDAPKSRGGGFFSVLLKLILAGAVAAVGVAAWRAYQKQRRGYGGGLGTLGGLGGGRGMDFKRF
ncbi:concanavalin A-like lectin/glucanase [Exidia glandulosa HHB12029]|uniref:Concanavalin A-like lectin/glucanase n=1 Tax=Exidia glandulosa HHB12029 TaxID=1314781 RepID=A0A165EJ84_EXIGL|nr:concanavalin A-like lectin/glucanase [Exidia glandulosa HHB12029]KZV87060.1 concanavalin A-like lectin/glucanase [Exidia glandulosa HHB12029]